MAIGTRKEVGARLRQMRVSCYLSQSELSRVSGVPLCSIVACETGRNFPRRNGEKIARVLKVPVKDWYDVRCPVPKPKPEFLSSISFWKRQKFQIGQMKPVDRQDYLDRLRSRIKKLSEAAGFVTLKELSRAVGWKISLYGSYLREAAVNAVAEKLGVSQEELLNVELPFPEVRPGDSSTEFYYHRQRKQFYGMIKGEREDFLRKLSSRIRRIAAKKYFNQEELACRTGIDRASICRIFGGKIYVMLSTAQALARELEISLEDLLDVKRPLPEVPARYFDAPESSWRKQRTIVHQMTERKKQIYFGKLKERAEKLALERGYNFSKLTRAAGIARGQFSSLPAERHFFSYKNTKVLTETLKVSVGDLVDVTRILPDAAPELMREQMDIWNLKLSPRLVFFLEQARIDDASDFQHRTEEDLLTINGIRSSDLPHIRQELARLSLPPLRRRAS